MRLALYQPDIPQNTGAAIRIAACFGANLDIIEPCGFPLNAREVRRTAMDYGAISPPVVHSSWSRFSVSPERRSGRLVLLTTTAETALWDFALAPTDIFLMGRESAGVPTEVHAMADAQIAIPMAAGARSLNVAVAAAIALAEAARQSHRI